MTDTMPFGTTESTAETVWIGTNQGSGEQTSQYAATFIQATQDRIHQPIPRSVKTGIGLGLAAAVFPLVTGLAPQVVRAEGIDQNPPAPKLFGTAVDSCRVDGPFKNVRTIPGETYRVINFNKATGKVRLRFPGKNWDFGTVSRSCVRLFLSGVPKRVKEDNDAFLERLQDRIKQEKANQDACTWNGVLNLDCLEAKN